VEWEELLVRYELAPRALALALADAAGGAGEGAARVVREMVARELAATRLLAAMRDGSPQAASTGEVEAAPPAALAAQFSELRRCNFAALQRRGLEVWEWRARSPELGELTAHQLLCQALGQDAAALAGLRAALAEAPAC
jgi:hypothetical protein